MNPNSPRIVIAALTLSAAAFVGLATREGYTDTAVIPVKGDVPTLGLGTTSGVKLGDRTTPIKAIRRSLQDMQVYEGAVRKCVHVPLYQYEYDAYMSLAYNIGTGAFCGSTLVKELNQEHYQGACGEILRWDRFQGRPLPGLTTRRRAEYLQCTGGAQ